MGGWPRFEFRESIHRIGCPGFRDVRKLGTTEADANAVLIRHGQDPSVTPR